MDGDAAAAGDKVAPAWGCWRDGCAGDESDWVHADAAVETVAVVEEDSFHTDWSQDGIGTRKDSQMAAALVVAVGSSWSSGVAAAVVAASVAQTTAEPRQHC